jgi:hypothetical protein
VVLELEVETIPKTSRYHSALRRAPERSPATIALGISAERHPDRQINPSECSARSS